MVENGEFANPPASIAAVNKKAKVEKGAFVVKARWASFL
jgi:hypothetical protein